MYSPWISKASAPAANRSHSNLTLVASRMRTTACVTSGPMPSPGIRVTLCVFCSAIVVPLALLLVFCGAAAAQQAFQLFLELAHVFEVPIDRRKANIRDRIQAF